MSIGGKCLANRANHCHTAVSPFMEKTQWLIEMRSTGFIERLDKNSAPCQGWDQISGGGTFDPPEVTVAWSGKKVGGEEWLGLGDGWCGEWEMVGRRGVGVWSAQPQPRFYIALVDLQPLSAMATTSATAICLGAASCSLCTLSTRVIAKKDNQRKRHETFRKMGAKFKGCKFWQIEQQNINISKQWIKVTFHLAPLQEPKKKQSFAKLHF